MHDVSTSTLCCEYDFKIDFLCQKSNDIVDSFSSNINFLIKKYKNNVYV